MELFLKVKNYSVVLLAVRHFATDVTQMGASVSGERLGGPQSRQQKTEVIARCQGHEQAS